MHTLGEKARHSDPRGLTLYKLGLLPAYNSHYCVLPVDSYLVYPRIIRKAASLAESTAESQALAAVTLKATICLILCYPRLCTGDQTGWGQRLDPGMQRNQELLSPFGLIAWGRGGFCSHVDDVSPRDRFWFLAKCLSLQIFPPFLSWVDNSLHFLFFFPRSFCFLFFIYIGGFLEKRWIA